MSKNISVCLHWLAVLFLLPVFVACSSDYRSAVPQDSIAIASFDFGQISSSGSIGKTVTDAALRMFHLDDVGNCGIDFREKVYAFETKDGYFGAVFCLSDKDDFKAWLSAQKKNGECTELNERRGYEFTVFNGNLMIGFSDEAMVMLGPVIPSDLSRLKRKMIGYFEAGEATDGIFARMTSKLDSINAPIALVARIAALPEKFVAPFMLGVSDEVSPNDIMISASVAVRNKCVFVTGETFSCNDKVSKVINAASRSYRPIGDGFIKKLSPDALISVLCCAEGEDFVRHIRRNESLRTMLFGLNTAIDIDKMLKSISGDCFFFVFPSMHNGGLDFQMLAELKNSDWLTDVDYWKKSCPEGTRIMDCADAGKFLLSSNDLSLYFGVNEKNHLYIATSGNLVENMEMQAEKELSPDIREVVSGKRLCAVINVGSLMEHRTEIGVMKDLSFPVVDSLQTVILCVK